MPNLYRQEKLGELIAEELSDLLRTRMKDPRIGFVSITRVEVSGDLAHAKVYVSVLGSDEERHNTMAALKRATGFLRHELAGRLVLRHVPELVFKLDLSLEKGAQVMELIKQIEQEHAQQQQGSQAALSAQPDAEEQQGQTSDSMEAE
ncbi:30S ribosome-binding factor RbfA [Thermogemmatispora carboxidivorans]|uniref:30S ribosome-binding factor RbfA n=1 Tax=Thermogemmatispora carboxidivorans TaxID=1382306 RepID=UPI0009DFEF4C|nr:30S ribosome-binding factor RbfA [Thermogemmatispora carboxidivorans]